MSSGYSTATADRPNVHRQTTGDVLSYYFQDAGGPLNHLSGGDVSRSASTSTSREGDRRSHHSGSQRTPPDLAPSSSDEAARVHKRRSSRTANAGDKRRLAIVELESMPGNFDVPPATDEYGADVAPSSQLLARRGFDSTRLAIVAPPDAAPITYSNLSPVPPVSAPPRTHDAEVKREFVSTAHQRSKSNMEGLRMHSKSFSSRDIGIVGAIRSPAGSPAILEDSRETRGYIDTKSLSMPMLGSSVLSPSDDSIAPIFQRPQTRTPSPDFTMGPSPNPSLKASLAPWLRSDDNLVTTPSIGESKELSTKVASPVVTMLPQTSGRSLPPANPTGSANGADGRVSGTMYSGSQSPPIASANASASRYATSPASSGSQYPSVSSGTTGSQGVSPAASHVSSPSSEYSGHGGSSYYPTQASPYQAQQYAYAMLGPGSHLGYDPILHATAGPLPEPPRLIPITPSAPPPRPPRLTTPHNGAIRRADAKTPDQTSQITPTQSPIISNAKHSPGSGSNYAATPTATTYSRAASDLSPVPAPVFTRQMSDFSITAVSASSSDSDQDRIEFSPALSRPDLLLPTSPLRLSPKTGEESRHVREGASAYPPSAFKRNSRQSDSSTSDMQTHEPRSARSSPTKAHMTVKSADEEVKLEEMLASFGHAIVAGALTPATTPSPAVSTPASDTEPLPSVAVSSPPLPALPSVSISSPPLPSLPSEGRLSQQQEARLERGASVRTERGSRSNSASTVPVSDANYAVSSKEGSMVHVSPPSSPGPNMPVIAEHHRAKPSLSLGPLQTSNKRSSAERSPSFSSLGRFAARAQMKAGLSSPVYMSKASKRARAIAVWPDSMRFEDVLKGKTALDRANGYARKINELARVETGLSQWITMVKQGPTTPDVPLSRPPSNVPVGPLIFAHASSHHEEPRKVSTGSTMSDASFPVRPDATVATDLSRGGGDSPPQGPPPTLPYPSLAQGIGIRSNSTRSYNTSLSVQSSPSTRSATSGPPGNNKKAAGFFSTIGRKASVRRERTLGPPNPNVLMKQNSSPLAPMAAMPESPTKPVRPTLGTLGAPSIPGGPRDPPSRSQRGLYLTRRSSADTASSREVTSPISPTVLDKRRSIAGPATHSLSGRSLETQRSMRAPSSPNGMSPAFAASLQKVADVLPQVDRSVLAQYLMEANGEDIVAITRCMEDQKRGVLKHS